MDQRPDDALPGTDARPAEESICLVVNPRAGAGRAGREVGELERLAAAHFARWAVRLTEGPGQGTALARAAAQEGFGVVAAVGGDGTCHEVVNGLMAVGSGAADRPVFTVVPFGTGSDLIRSLLIPRDVEQALTVARAGRTRPADVGHLSATALAGNPSERFFINEVSFGMGGEVVARVNRSSKRLGGFASFLGATVGALAQFRPQRVELAWEGPAGPGTWEGELTNAFLANGHFCGGGMLVGKGGSMFDGLFDLTVLPPMSLATSAANLPRLYRGTSHEARGAFRVPVTRLAARCLAPEATVLVDSDGEQPGRLPLVARVVPGALRIRGRWTDDAPPAV